MHSVCALQYAMFIIASGSVALNSQPILNGKADLVHGPVEEVEHGNEGDVVSTNGHLNGVTDNGGDFVQGHSKDTQLRTRSESLAQSSGEDGEGEMENVQDDDYEDEGEDDEEEEEEEEEEPALKYERLGGAVPNLLEKDTASAVAVSVKFLVRSYIWCIL